MRIGLIILFFLKASLVCVFASDKGLKKVAAVHCEAALSQIGQNIPQQFGINEPSISVGFVPTGKISKPKKSIKIIRFSTSIYSQKHVNYLYSYCLFTHNLAMYFVGNERLFFFGRLQI